MRKRWLIALTSFLLFFFAFQAPTEAEVQGKKHFWFSSGVVGVHAEGYWWKTTDGSFVVDGYSKDTACDGLHARFALVFVGVVGYNFHSQGEPCGYVGELPQEGTSAGSRGNQSPRRGLLPIVRWPDMGRVDRPRNLTSTHFRQSLDCRDRRTSTPDGRFDLSIPARLAVFA